MDTSKSNSILSKLDEQIAPNDFFERLCLVKTSDAMVNDIVAPENEVVAAYQLWPALKYNSIRELLNQIKDKKQQCKIILQYSKFCRNVGTSDTTNTNSDESGIAYLIGWNESQSTFAFVPKNDEGVIVEDNQSVFDFCTHIDEIERAIERAVGYCGLAQFQAAYTLAINRMEQYFAMNDEKEELEKTSTPSAPGDIDVSGGGTDTEKAESDVDESFSAQATVCSQMISPSDVEGSAALQLGITHPSKPNQKNCRKRKHITPSPRSRNTNVCKRREKESSDTKGGSTLVVNKLPPLKATSVSAATDTASNCTKGHIANNRTCLLDAIAVHVPIKVKEEVSSSVYSSMPSEGDTSINDANRGLAKHGMTLKRVSGYYIKKGGAPLHLLQIQEQCRIVIRIKLVTLENEVANHFVAWDGSTVFDRPKNAEVNRTSDRSSKKSCNAVFERLYPKNQFLSWQITNVYELCYL